MLVVSLFLINPIMALTQKLLYWGVFCPCLTDESEPADDAATDDIVIELIKNEDMTYQSFIEEMQKKGLLNEKNKPEKCFAFWLGVWQG